MHPVRLNSAGRLAQSFIESKLTPLFVVAGFLLAIFSSLVTPREENPQIIVPAVQVTWLLPGATPEEVDRLVVVPMEAALREIDGVKHSSAAAAHGIGRVMVEFHVGQDEDRVLERVKQRVAVHRDRLPRATLDPRIEQIRVDDAPIVTLTLASQRYDDYALRRLAERIAERLNNIKEVSVTQIHGGRLRELRVNLDPARLQAHGLTLNEGIAAITGNNVDALAGHSTRNGSERLVYLDGRLSSAEGLRRLPLAERGGRLIHLEDLAEVVDGPAPERDHVTRLAFGSGNPLFAAEDSQGEMAAVTISVAKKPGTNAVEVSRDVLTMVEKIRAQIVPADVHVVTTRDDGRNANRVVNHLIFDLAIAITVVTLLLVPALGGRQAMIVALVIPLVIGLTLAVDLLAGVTINRMSMFGLILALGMLVDDAIVVMENIHRHYEQGTTDRRWTAVLATHEIGTPTTLATITIVLVFLSLSLLTGMNGAFFFPISFNVAVAIAASLLVAYVVVPWACHHWLPAPAGHRIDQPPGLLERRYSMAVTALVEHPRRANALFAGILLLLLASSMMMAWQFIRPSGVEGPLSFGGVGLSIMPRENRNTFTIWLDLAEGTPIETTDRVAREVGELVSAQPMVDHYLSYVGIPGVVDFAGQISGGASRQGPNVAELRVNLIDKSERRTQSGAVIDELRGAVRPIQSRYPDLDVRFIEAPAGPPSAAVILAHIHGPDPEVLRGISAEVKALFRTTYGAVDVFDTEATQRTQVDVVVDKDKAMLSGVSTADIEQTLRALMDGLVIAQTHVEGEKNPVPVRIRVPRHSEIAPELLDRILVRNARGQAIPVSELADVVTRPSEAAVQRRDNERISIVGGNVTPNTAPIYAILAMNQKLAAAPVAGQPLRTGNLSLVEQAPNSLDGYQLLWDGELRVTFDSFREMSLIFGVVVLMIYLLLVAAYRSFLLPVLGMIAIPLGIIGVFPGHWLVDINFSMASLIGVVALAGVVVRNSLLIIDFIHDYQRQGHPLREAVKLAGAVRLRPILLTSSALILATLVLYRDPLFAGLATSMIFGTLTSTGLTLLALPPLYERVARHFPEWVREPPDASGRT